MDPAESDKVRQALSSQGTRIGQHDAALQEFSEVLRGFSVGMTELGARMEQIGSQVSSLAAPGSIHGPAVSSASDFHAAAHVASPSQLREPFIPTPVRYSGELGRCRQFLHQCTLVFEQQPLSYASDRTKTAFMMSLLSDQAADWAVANSINRPSLALPMPILLTRCGGYLTTRFGERRPAADFSPCVRARTLSLSLH